MASRQWITMWVAATAVAFASAALGQERGLERRGRSGVRGPDRWSAKAARGPRPAAERGERLFGALDANGDGKIDRHEFSKRMPEVMKRFARHDRMPGGQGQRRTSKAGKLPHRLRGMAHHGMRGAIGREPVPTRWGKGYGSPPPGPAFGPHGRGPAPKRPPHGRMGIGGPPIFCQFDTNRDGKLQTPELERALDVLQQAVRESGGREITVKKWAQMTKKLRVGPQPKQPSRKTGPPPRAEKPRPPKGQKRKPTTRREP